MSTQEEINKIEQRAQELLTNLDKLHQEVGSYQAAKNELQKASGQLLTLVESTKKLSEESHKIIESINRIGSGKIFERLENIEKRTKTYFIILAGTIGLVLALQVVFFFLK
jgi:uncharacterized protein (DUF3084 family)